MAKSAFHPPLSVEPRLDFVLTLAELRRLASDSAMDLGVEAQARELVGSFVASERRVEAEVTLGARHRATLEVRGMKLATRCSCGVIRTGLCGHVVATALEWMARSGPQAGPARWPGNLAFQAARALIEQTAREVGPGLLKRTFRPETDRYGQLVDQIDELCGDEARRLPWTVSAYACARLGRLFAPGIGRSRESVLYPIAPTTRGSQPVPAPERLTFAWWTFHEELEGRSIFPGFGSGFQFREMTDDAAAELYRSLLRWHEGPVLVSRPDPWLPESARTVRLRRMASSAREHANDVDEAVRILSQGVGTFSGLLQYVRLLIAVHRRDDARNAIDTAMERLPSALRRGNRRMLLSLRPPATDDEAYEKAWGVLVERTDAAFLWQAWQAAQDAKSEPEFFDRARALLVRISSRPPKQPSALRDIHGALLALAFFSQDLHILELAWGISVKEEQFWTWVESHIHMGGSTFIILIVPWVLFHGLDCAPPAAHETLYDLLGHLVETTPGSHSMPWFIEWRQRFLKRHGKHREFADLVRRKFPKA